MELINNFMIIENLSTYLIFIWILLLGAVFNFAISGLLGKFGEKFSNFISVATLILSLIFILLLVLGFGGAHSISEISYFNGKLILNGKNAIFCAVFTLGAVLGYLTNLKFLKYFRHKTHYFNTLFLISALCSNIALISNDFLTFILSLEIVSICTFFIIFGKKTPTSSFNALKFFIFSFLGTIFMLFSWAISNGFGAQNEALNAIAKAFFVFGLLFKAGFSIFFGGAFNGAKNLDFPVFSYVNLNYFILFLLIFAQKLNIASGTILENFFIVYFLISMLVCVLNAFRAREYQNLFYLLNGVNFNFLAFAIIPQTLPVGAMCTFILSILLINTAILNLFAIFSFNNPNKFLLNDFYGIYFKNPKYSALLAFCFYIFAGIFPTSLIISKTQLLAQFLRADACAVFATLCTIFALCVTLLICLKFTSDLYKRPSDLKMPENNALKKRTKLNYFVLLVSLVSIIILSIVKLL